MTTEQAPTDSTGRPLMVGDLLRCYHFTAAKRRKVYMYKIAIRVSSDLQVCADGNYWYGMDVQSLCAEGINKAHKCRIDVLDHFEVIDGPAVQKPDGLECWWERKKVKAVK